MEHINLDNGEFDYFFGRKKRRRKREKKKREALARAKAKAKKLKEKLEADKIKLFAEAKEQAKKEIREENKTKGANAPAHLQKYVAQTPPQKKTYKTLIFVGIAVVGVIIMYKVLK